MADMVGQEYIVRALQNAVQNNRLHHAFLFTGTRGVGKTTLARILTMLINCQNRDSNSAEPCLQCPLCLQIQQGSLPDVIELDAASHTQVEKMRDLLDGAAYAAVQAPYKVFIIDEVHMLSKSAFNAMLKTLEEPPAHIKFILATTDPEKVPATIRSRCLCFALLPLTPHQISARLISILAAENIAHDETAITTISRLANGSLRDALSILDQAILHGNNKLTADDVRRITGEISLDLLASTLRAVIQEDANLIQSLKTQYLQESISFDSALNSLAVLIHKIALCHAIKNAAQNEETALLNEFTQLINPEQCQMLYEIAVRGRQQLPLAPTPDTGFEMTLLRMMLFVPQSANKLPATPAAATMGAIVGANTGATPPPTNPAPAPVPTPAAPPASTAPAPTPAAPPPPVAPLDVADATASPASAPPSNPATTTTPAAKPTSVATAPEQSFEQSFNWEATKATLPTTAQPLAQVCTAVEYNANGIHLLIDKSHQNVIDQLLPFLTKALQQKHGEHFTLTTDINTNNAAQEKTLNQNLQHIANTSIYQSAKKIFPDVKIIPDSIKTHTTPTMETT